MLAVYTITDFPLAFVDVAQSLSLNMESNVNSELLTTAAARCHNAGYSQELHRISQHIIFSCYDSLVCTAPWTRHPATEALKKIILTLRVNHFLFSHLSCLLLIYAFRSVEFSLPEKLILMQDGKRFGLLTAGRL